MRFGGRVVRPVRLTIYTENELRRTADTLQDLNSIHMEQCARILVEAYLQGTLLPGTELSILFLRSPSVMGNLVKAYMNLHHGILPTPSNLASAF